MLEEISKFCKEHKIDASIPDLDEILTTYSAVVETFYGFLVSQSLEKNKFIAAFIQYCESIENIAHFGQLLANDHILTPENIKIVLENVDMLNIIFTADQNFRQDLGKLDTTISTLSTQKKSLATNSVLMSMQIARKNLESLQKNLKEKYSIGELTGISAADCLTHLELLRSIFEKLKENDLFDDEHILAVTINIDAVALAMTCINNSSILTDENKKTYVNLLIQNPAPQVLNFVKILDNNHLLTEANLKMLFEEGSKFKNSRDIKYIFPVETPPNAVSRFSDFDQELFEIFVNHPSHWYKMERGLCMLYDFYELTPTEEEAEDSSEACTFDDGMLRVKNKNQVTERINALKEKVAPQLMKDRKWICEHPAHADVVAQIITHLRQTNLALSDDKFKSLFATENDCYFKTVLDALNCLHPQVNKDGFSFIGFLEASELSPVRNATKENMLTQEIFDVICEDPSKAMKIAFEKGIQITDEENEDWKMAEKIGVSLGAACEKPENSLPVGVAKLIGFWACENKLDHGSIGNIVAENFYASSAISCRKSS